MVQVQIHGEATRLYPEGNHMGNDCKGMGRSGNAHYGSRKRSSVS